MTKQEKNFIKVDKRGGPAGFTLFVAFMGAAVYFINQVDGFWNIVLAVLKAIVWPAILLYSVLQHLGV